MLNDEQMFELLISYCQRERAKLETQGSAQQLYEWRAKRQRGSGIERVREGELFFITLHSKQAPNGNLLQVATSIVVPQLVSSLKRCFLCSYLSLLFNS